MATITIPDEAYQLLEQRAQSVDCTIEEVLEYILWEKLASRRDPRLSSQGWRKPISRYALEHELYERNMKVFDKLLPELLKEHKDEYVAIRHEQVVGFGDDLWSLQEEIRNNYGPGGGLLVAKISTALGYLLRQQSLWRR